MRSVKATYEMKQGQLEHHKDFFPPFIGEADKVSKRGQKLWKGYMHNLQGGMFIKIHVSLHDYDRPESI